MTDLYRKSQALISNSVITCHYSASPNKTNPVRIGPTRHILSILLSYLFSSTPVYGKDVQSHSVVSLRRGQVPSWGSFLRGFPPHVLSGSFFSSRHLFFIRVSVKLTLSNSATIVKTVCCANKIQKGESKAFIQTGHQQYSQILWLSNTPG